MTPTDGEAKKKTQKNHIDGCGAPVVAKCLENSWCHFQQQLNPRQLLGRECG